MLNIILLAVLFIAGSCTVNPEPINFGTDQCEHCRMTIVDNKFGAEIITNKGKIFKFDAAECMVKYVKDGKISDSDIKEYLVIDASKPGQFTNAKKAVYLVSENFPSPMGANISAFGNKNDADSFQKNYQGDIKDWDRILTKLKAK
jgi:copper chaperone NosL